MVEKLEFNEDGSIKSIAFVDGLSHQFVAAWLHFINGWNNGRRTDAIKLLDEQFNGDRD